MKSKSPKELIDNGVPYCVNPDDLRALQIEPDVYFKSGYGGWAGWMLGPQERRGADRASAVTAFASQGDAVSASTA